MRRRRRLLGAGALAVALAWWLVGCTSTIHPPDDALTAPTTVFVAFDARHTGLVLPRGERGYVEYGYGEWAWYAEGRDAWYRAFPTVLWPTTGTLGRRTANVADAAALREAWSWMRLEPIEVEHERVERLRAELDAAFTARADEMHRNEAYAMDFVPADDGFWCLFNCSDAVSLWLEELGCSVSWVPIRVDLEVARE